MSERLESGLIINYPYLWRWQFDQGRDDAVKHRPVCLAISAWNAQQELTHLVILAISSAPPAKDRRVLEIPALEIRRAGLSSWKRAWLVIDEYNYDVAERSYHFEIHQRPKGSFSPRFMDEVRRAIRPMFSAASGRIDRTV